MPQSLVVTNGNLLASFDERLMLRDFFYPNVGQENHSEFSKKHRVGFHVGDNFHWLDDSSWQFEIDYHPNTLVGNSTATNNELGLKVQFEDFVYTTHDILFRKLTITNNSDHTRDVKCFFSHDFYLYGDKKEDTAQYEPNLNGVLHYRRQRYFLVNGQWADTGLGMTEFTTGKANYDDKEGTWRDAEDGHLHEHAIEQGSVDSTVGFYRHFDPRETLTLYVWIAAGTNYSDIERNYNRVKKLGPERIMAHTYGYWEQWSQKSGFKTAGLPKEAQRLWNQSLLIVRSQTDNRGAIIASTDSDIMQFNKDTYAYSWPRDGALICNALARAGYYEVVKRYLMFCRRTITPNGYVLHKYNPDGSLGSSWHPKWKNGKPQLPIQQDESALLLVSLWELYDQSKSIEIAQQLFNPMVLKIGRWLASFVDERTGLPHPTYGLWEEQRSVFSYTASTVYGGLMAAAKLSHATGHHEDEDFFKDAAQKLQKAIVKYLYSETDQRFCKSVFYEQDTLKHDATVDASLTFVWEMGVLPPDDPKVINTMNAIRDQLTVRTDVGGLARYTGDFYHRIWDREHEYSEAVPGNPWIITTLWLANWEIERATTLKDLKAPKEKILWTISKANSAGILPEQLDPFTNQPISVAPLTWSHATYVDTVMRFSEKYRALSQK